MAISGAVPIEEPTGEATALFEDILRRGTSLRVKVTGRSMTPFLKGGEIVTIKNTTYRELLIGDIIFFKNDENRLILHRLIKKSSAEGPFHTKGDASAIFDTPVSKDNILGKVCKIERGTSPVEVVANMETLQWKTLNFLTAILNPPKRKVHSILGGIIKRYAMNPASNNH